jgi:PIF1-like helicase
MHLGGMGGTGKTQVIKALSAFFEARNESHRFIIVVPTGTAAVLLGESMYHSMFGINERMSSNKIENIKAKPNSIEYVFFNEVSMLSARDLHRINAQLAKVFDIAEIPFGGLNMVFSGNFGQLPPTIRGKHVSLYSRTIGTVCTNKKSQEVIEKALWHQITTVVILRQNMRQSKQSTEDTMMRTALENLRYKGCTPVDINFWRTKISSSLPDRSLICDKDFRDVSIITGTNLQKDKINRLGAICFAQKSGQDLVDFYSEDISNVSPSDLDKASGTKQVA